ncbi:GTP-binding protein Rheb [Poecilia reticulata]|uniref:GTP-binding protein Rheb n=1 Tax=Poecilia reticulata TaxID=8081 RepID=UPI0004A2DE75|nr:PREDICTED: GTP-binding protein Rheb [Poecilia reticulata]XP_008400381.1 PREDICTED: GTP-binding protein Rheb [Poecilia reticulata]
MQWAATGSGFGTRCPPGHQNIRYRFHPNGSVVPVRLPGGPGGPRDVGNVQYANPNGSDPPGRRNRVRLDSLVCFCRKPIILMGNKKNLHMERVLGCGSVWAQFKEPVWNRTWRKSTSRRNMSPSNRTCSGSASSKEGKALTGSWSAAFLESPAKDHQMAVEVIRRMVLEVEQVEGGLPGGSVDPSGPLDSAPSRTTADPVPPLRSEQIYPTVGFLSSEG